MRAREDLHYNPRTRALGPASFAMARLGIVKHDPPVRGAPRLSDLGLQKIRHPIPRKISASDIVGGAALVGEGVRRIVSIDLMLDPRRFQGLFEIVDPNWCAPVVLVRKMALKRHPDLGWVRKLPRRDAIETHAGGKLRNVHGSSDGQRSTHAITDHCNVGALRF